MYSHFIFNHYNPLAERKVEIVLLFKYRSDDKCFFAFNVIRNEKNNVKEPKRKRLLHFNIYSRQIKYCEELSYLNKRY